MDIVTNFPSYFLAGVQNIDPIYAGVIAVFFGLANASIIGLFVVPAMAAAVYIAARTVIPPLINHAPIVTPHFDTALLEHGIVLYVVFFAAVVIVFAAKKTVLGLIG